jgi:glycosyltransferase involved in cell wall biosynthesis
VRIVMLASGSPQSDMSARLVRLGRELVKNGHEVFMLAPSADRRTGFRREMHNAIDGVTVIIPFHLATKYATINLIPYIPSALFHTIRLQAQIVYVYKPTPISVLGFVGKVRCSTRVVLDMDDLGSEVMLREGNARWKVALVRWSEHFAERHSDGIVAASSFLARRYHALYPLKPVVVIPNGADSSSVMTSPRSEPAIVFLGSLNSRSVLEPLLRALPLLADRQTKLRVVGSGTQAAYFKSLTRELDLAGRVEFTGWVTHDRIGETMVAGDLGYCCVPDEPAYRAASNQKVFDYMALGVVPVVNRVGDLPRVVEHGRAGYIVETDLVTCLNAALCDQKGRLARSRAGSQLAATVYSWSSLASRLEVALSQIAS